MTDSDAEPGAGAQAGLAGGSDGESASVRTRRQRVISGACWAVVFGGALALLALAADLASPIRACPPVLVSDGGLVLGPKYLDVDQPHNWDLIRAIPADEVPGYEATVHLAPPLVRCRQPSLKYWPPSESRGPSPGTATIDRWTGASVICLAVLETAAAAALVLKIRQRRR